MINIIIDLLTYLKILKGDSLNLSDVLELVPYKYFWFRDLVLSRKNPKIDAHYNELFQILQSYKTENYFTSPTNILKHIHVLELIPIHDLTFTKEEEKVYNNYINYLKSFTTKDFIRIKKIISNELEKMYSLPETKQDCFVIPTNNNLSQKDFFITDYLLSLITICDFLIADSKQQKKTIDQFSIVRNVIENSIQINSHTKGFLIRFTKQDTLQSLASRYLGNQDRWLEIVIANGLKPPYVDFEGIEIIPLQNPFENKVYILKTYESNVFLNLDIYLYSNYIEAEKRKIININNFTSYIILTLSGDCDLNKFSLEEGFRIKIYKPNTINDNCDILIPSENGVDLKAINKFINIESSIDSVAGTDLLISNKGDLVFSKTGDFEQISGYENIIQAVKLILSTEKGALQRHQEYGIDNIIGLPYSSEQEYKNTLVETIVRAVESDPRILKVESIRVTPLSEKNPQSPKGYSFVISVFIKGVKEPVPITFNI